MNASRLKMDREIHGTFIQWNTTLQEKNDLLKFAGKWMELKNIKLSEVTQTQKDKYFMYSLISGF